MNLNPTEEQCQIAEAVGDMMRSEAPFDRWFMVQTDMLAEERRLLDFGTEMGWIGFAAPESAGGSEAGLIDEMLVFRELGARLAPVGVGFAALAARLALSAGQPQWAHDILTGQAGVALVAGADGRTLLGAAGAKFALRIAADSVQLSSLDQPCSASLGWDGLTSVAQVESSLTDGEAVSGGRAFLNQFRLIMAAQLQGLARTAVAESNAYAKERHQFGRAIGSFQAVRHRIADMEMANRRAEAALYYAAVSLENAHADADFQLLSALVLAQDAALLNAQTNIANHGAIGVTEENVGHFLLKRALLFRLASGAYEGLLDELAEQPAPVI